MALFWKLPGGNAVVTVGMIATCGETAKLSETNNLATA
jgi:hypothetical protein